MKAYDLFIPLDIVHTHHCILEVFDSLKEDMHQTFSVTVDPNSQSCRKVIKETEKVLLIVIIWGWTNNCEINTSYNKKDKAIHTFQMKDNAPPIISQYGVMLRVHTHDHFAVSKDGEK